MIYINPCELKIRFLVRGSVRFADVLRVMDEERLVRDRTVMLEQHTLAIQSLTITASLATDAADSTDAVKILERYANVARKLTELLSSD